MSILVLADYHDGALSPATAHVVAAAKQISQAGGGEIHMLVAGEGVGAVAEAAARLDGVAKVRVADHAVYAHQLAEPLGDLLVALADDYGHVLSCSSTTGKNILPRLAALKDVGQLSEIIAAEGADTFRRPIYAGNAIATVQSEDALKVITVRATAFEAVGEVGSAAVEAVDFVADHTRSRFVKEALAESDRPELGSAKVVISGGRGMGNGENAARRHRRQAGGGHRRLPGRRRCRLRAQRHAGRPDRQAPRISTSPWASAAPFSTWRG